ncbi:MAG: hypothetical protein HPY45_01850 [Anaerolineae bacterium]|nr:hypothetical protein [Anaerolineae bacterium]
MNPELKTLLQTLSGLLTNDNQQAAFKQFLSGLYQDLVAGMSAAEIVSLQAAMRELGLPADMM